MAGPLLVRLSAADGAHRRLDALTEAFPLAAADPEDVENSAAVDLRVTASTADLYPDAPGDPARYSLWIGSEHRLDGAPMWRLEDHLLHEMNRWVLDADDGRLHLHAALVSREGHSMLIAGASGSGKSTLTTHLVRSGWQFHTDEMVAVLLDGRLEPYPRPLSLKRGSWARFADVPSVPDDPALEPPDRFRANVPAGELGPVAAVRPTTPSLLVVLRRRDEDPGLEQLDAAEAASALIDNTMDLERAGLDGMRHLVQLAAAAPAVRLRTEDDLDATAATLLRHLGGVRRSTSPLEIPPTGRPEDRTVTDLTDVGLLQRRDLVWAWTFEDGRTLIHDLLTGRAVRVNALGGAVWSTVDGHRSMEAIRAEVSRRLDGAAWSAGAEVDAFLAQLAQLGLLASR